MAGHAEPSFIHRENGESALDFARRAFEAIYGRPATPEEVAEIEDELRDDSPH